ncbi:hypothetical protein ACN42_g7553 [Penicillium freii]|uniref:Uncharacterized protein n=1 Tax=Penicillium freii TaxID=48697 RepID=A0A101MFQ5_PENFR|nr:hypothetical protein ACN42_g7553 [Penicillium freii]
MVESDTRVARYGDDTELFLETLPPPVPRYIYRESQQFHKILDYETARFRNLNHALAVPSHEIGFQSTLPGTDNTNDIIFLIEPSSFQEEIVNRKKSRTSGFLLRVRSIYENSHNQNHHKRTPLRRPRNEYSYRTGPQGHGA